MPPAVRLAGERRLLHELLSTGCIDVQPSNCSGEVAYVA
jgi:hypothetical protein